MSVVQVFLGRPGDLLPSIFPSSSCGCDELCLIRCPRYCNFLVLNCLTISLPVPILLNTSSLVIFSVLDIFNTLQYTHISKAPSLDNRDFVTVHVSAQCLIQDKISTSPSPTDRSAVVTPRGRRAARSRTVVTLGDIFT